MGKGFNLGKSAGKLAGSRAKGAAKGAKGAVKRNNTFRAGKAVAKGAGKDVKGNLVNSPVGRGAGKAKSRIKKSPSVRQASSAGRAAKVDVGRNARAGVKTLRGGASKKAAKIKGFRKRGK